MYRLIKPIEVSGPSRRRIVHVEQTTEPSNIPKPIVLTNEQQLLVTRHAGLVYLVANRYRKIPVQDWDNLVAHLYLQLCKSIPNIDHTKKSTPANYLMTCLSGAAKKFFRDENWVIRPSRTLRQGSIPEGDTQLKTMLRPDSLNDRAVVENWEEDELIDLLPSNTNIEHDAVERIGGNQILRDVFQSLGIEERLVLSMKMKGRKPEELQKRFPITRKEAYAIIDEVDEKARTAYLLSSSGKKVPKSEGSSVLIKALRRQFKPPTSVTFTPQVNN